MATDYCGTCSFCTHPNPISKVLCLQRRCKNKIVVEKAPDEVQGEGADAEAATAVGAGATSVGAGGGAGRAATAVEAHGVTTPAGDGGDCLAFHC